MDSFTYRATNGTLSSTVATVTVAVLAGQPACRLIPQNALIVMGAQASFRLTSTVEVTVGGTPASGVPVLFRSARGEPISISDDCASGRCDRGLTRNGAADFFVVGRGAADSDDATYYIGHGAGGSVGGSSFECTGRIDVELVSYTFSTLRQLIERGHCWTRSVIPGGSGSALNTLRNFRDGLLARSDAGRRFTAQYYQFSPELVRISLRSPGLAVRAWETLERYLPLAQAALDGRRPSMSREELSQIGSLIKEIQFKASPEFRQALDEFWNRLSDRGLLAQFGFRLEESTAPALTPTVADSRVPEGFWKLPLVFEGMGTEYTVRGLGYSLHLKPKEAVIALGKTNGTAPGVRLRFDGAGSSTRAQALDELPGRSHYLTGSDPAQWRTNVRQYAKLRYEGVYPGVDLVYYGNQ